MRREEGTRRDELLARLAARTPRRGGPAGGRIAAVVLGWLVLMTVWGFGRAWHGGMAPVELVLGLVGGGVTSVVAWRRVDRRDDAG